jgi:hypothetical protein
MIAAQPLSAAGGGAETLEDDLEVGGEGASKTRRSALAGCDERQAGSVQGRSPEGQERLPGRGLREEGVRVPP